MATKAYLLELLQRTHAVVDVSLFAPDLAERIAEVLAEESQYSARNARIYQARLDGLSYRKIGRAFHISHVRARVVARRCWAEAGKPASAHFQHPSPHPLNATWIK